MVQGHPDIPGLVNWQPLARGGFSVVWQARQETLDRLVAVKVDHRALTEDKERRRFLREAGAAGRLSDHMGIVTVHDAGILSDGRPYLVMDLCTGGSLTRWLKPEGRQSQQRVRDVGVRIADALAAAHARGVLHRDVKPANILIDAYGHPGLADFGLAALPEPGTELSVTMEGMTPAYAPKEVFYLDPPSEFGDVYSLAATLYALLQGRPPRWPESGSPSLPQLIELQGQPIARLPGVDDEFMDVLLRALDDDPGNRPTAAQFRDQLAAVTFAPAAAAAEVSGAGVATPTGRRRSRAAFLIASAVTAALIVVVAFTWGTSGRKASPAAVGSPPEVRPTTLAASSAPPSSISPSPSPSPSAKVSKAPEGFVDCSEQLGGKNYYCVDPKSPECWDDPYAYKDLPKVAGMRACDDYHLDQTFAAGELPTYIRSQSKFEARNEVRKLCTRETLDKVLRKDKALKDWQIQALPVQTQIEGDNLFRCLVGAGMRTKPFALKVPSG